MALYIGFLSCLYCFMCLLSMKIIVKVMDMINKKNKKIKGSFAEIAISRLSLLGSQHYGTPKEREYCSVSYKL